MMQILGVRTKAKKKKKKKKNRKERKRKGKLLNPFSGIARINPGVTILVLTNRKCLPFMNEICFFWGLTDLSMILGAVLC